MALTDKNIVSEEPLVSEELNNCFKNKSKNKPESIYYRWKK